MKIVIRNHLAGSFLLEQEPKVWDAVVVLDPKMVHSGFVAEQARRHLYLRFDDVEGETQGKRAPTLGDVRAAVEFAEEAENLLVCCRAGQSRSEALAVVVGCRRLGLQAAIALLDPRRHIPNPLVVDLGARVLDDPFLLPASRQWKKGHAHIRIADYLDDVESELDELERQGACNRILESGAKGPGGRT